MAQTARESAPAPEAPDASRESGGHPELGLERARLEETLAAMERAIDRPIRRTGGADEEAVIALAIQRAWYREELRQALASPYFARLDFHPEGGAGPETFYIGKTYFAGEGVEVTGWQAPLASLFYRATREAASYLAPEGEIRGRLRLKRRLVIDHGRLTHVADDLDTRPLSDRPAALATGAPSEGPAVGLAGALSGPASPWLQDIIATIQPEQFELIAAPGDEVLVVQGVAGSGKTSIALHRLSYLGYPDLAAGRVAPRCLVFGPNRLFLQYISAVLPKLGLRHAEQTTIADWALARLFPQKPRPASRPPRSATAPPPTPRPRLVDPTFEALLDPATPPETKDALSRVSRLKTSSRMGLLLQRYVEWRRLGIDIPAEGWLVRLTVEGRPLEHRLSAAELREAHGRFQGQSFALHRALFAGALPGLLYDRDEARDATAQDSARARLSQGQRRLQQAHEQRAAADRLRATGTAPLATVRQYELAAARRRQEGEALIQEAEAALSAILTPPQREAARRAAPAAVRRLVDAHWPAIDPRRDCPALLADAPLLERLGAGLFSAQELATLHASPPTDAAVIDRADLPALHYLFVLSQGADAVGRAQHAYVVVDEAQDVSPLDLLCLRHLEQRPCFTLLGDLAQSIYAHRGLTSWDEAAEVFAGGPYRYAESRIGYRTTAEITALANRVRSGTASGGQDGTPDGAPQSASSGAAAPALAFDRHGPPPVLSAVAGEAEAPGAVVAAVAGLRREGHASVGIITRTPARALALAPLLVRAGLPDAQLALAPDFSYRGGVIVLPVALAKGLEFDAAVVVDADGSTYGPSAFDARLLYVALTRALHALRVIWAGNPSPHLGDAGR